MKGSTRRHDATEAGTVTLWMLGLCVAVLFLGGIALDLWRAFSERRALVGAVDGAAVAAASALDEAAFRADGSVRLDPDRASAVACRYLRTHVDPPLACGGIQVASDAVEVTASQEVALTLLRVLLPAERPLLVEVTALAEPRRSP